MSEVDLATGDVVAGKYAVVEAIGVGGSATVYRAQRVGMKHEVALKVMHAEHPDSDNERQRFAREAEMVMKLQHPHVVPLLDYGHTEDGVPFLVFALLHGQSLERKIKTDGSLPWALAGRLSVQVLRALEKAHGLGVVHRDIKPANIFLSNGVLGEVAQVLDFGLAKVVSKEEMGLTQTGALLGTPRYMAPEQVRGENITHAADIYSFGLVMAEMLLGRPLVDGAKELDIYVAQGSDKPIYVPDEVLTTPFGPIIQRAVSKPVSVRYHMASQMLADVEATLKNLSGPPTDVEADLEATRMLDPSMAPSVMNPHAEKMRRVLNAAANKAEKTKEAADRASRPSIDAVPETTVKSAVAEAPAHRMASMSESVAVPLVAPPPHEQGAPLPTPAQTSAHQTPAYQTSAYQPQGPAGPGVRGVPAEHVQGQAQPFFPVEQLYTGAPAYPHAAAAGAAVAPTSLLPTQIGAPDPYAPHTAAGAPAAMPGPPMQPPMQLQQGHAARAPMPTLAEPRGQTGVLVALVIVILLILAGVGAILWLLGIVTI